MQPNTSNPAISIIIPVLREQTHIHTALHALNQQIGIDRCQVIVVDGDTEGSTLKAIDDQPILALTSERGRGRQMNTGAQAACAPILLFLHADTRLPPHALDRIQATLTNPTYVGGAFDLSIDTERLFLKYITWRANLRSRTNRIPYGDQAIFIRKRYFQELTGFRDIPIMEDLDFMYRIKRHGGKIHILKDRVITSPRRWETEGALFTTLRNQLLVMLYYLGINPRILAKLYPNQSDLDNERPIHAHSVQ
jgi:rSAM/selenodomain-associated transferase 2